MSGTLSTWNSPFLISALLHASSWPQGALIFHPLCPHATPFPGFPFCLEDSSEAQLYSHCSEALADSLSSVFSLHLVVPLSPQEESPFKQVELGKINVTLIMPHIVEDLMKVRMTRCVWRPCP